MSKTNKKGLIIALIALVVAAVAILTGCRLTGPQAETGSKTITVEVVFADGTTKEHTIQTDAQYLRGALEENGLVSGKTSSMGLFITTVDGVTADDSQQQWWCITKGGESVMTGVDQTPIADGDHFEITLKTGYDS